MRKKVPMESSKDFVETKNAFLPEIRNRRSKGLTMKCVLEPERGIFAMITQCHPSVHRIYYFLSSTWSFSCTYPL
jgi:hypothetical protein